MSLRHRHHEEEDVEDPKDERWHRTSVTANAASIAEQNTYATIQHSSQTSHSSEDKYNPQYHHHHRPKRRIVTRKKKKKKRQGINAVEYVKRFLILVSVVSVVGSGFILYTLVLHPRLVHPPKLSALPADFQVSVVLMNHFRPRMIRESTLLKTLLEHAHVAEVLLCHSNPHTKFDFSHPKVQNIDAVAANTERGLSLRFYYCYTAATRPYVIIVDDDQEVTSAAMDTLLQTFAAQPNRIVGRYGRTFQPSWSKRNHGYNTRTVFGAVEVVLTKLLVAPREYCGNFLRYESLVQDLLPQSQPKWNGEDIFFSLVANHVNHVPNDGPFDNLAVYFGGVSEASNDFKDDDGGIHDISGNMDRHVWYRAVWAHDTWLNYTTAVERAHTHTAYRGTLWSTAKARLAQLGAAEEKRLAQQFTDTYAAIESMHGHSATSFQDL